MTKSEIIIPQSTPQSTWTLTNIQAIIERLLPIHAQPDGTLYAELHGVNFIVVTKSFNHVRLWILDPQEVDSGVVQSELNLENPLHLVDPYTQAAILGMGWVPEPKRIYCAGLGAGRVPMILHHHLPHATIDCSEIDPTVLEMATRFFGFAEDERLQVHIADGRRWLEEVAPYDFIFVDVFLDRGYVPYRLSTVEFYQLCREKLTPGGILVVNLLTEDAYLANRVATLQEVFGREQGHVTLCPLSEGNTVIFATNSTTQHLAPNTEVLLKRIVELQADHHFAFPLATRALDLTTDFAAAEIDLSAAQPFYDETPPPAYFDLLPSFENLLTPIESALPCPCGSGETYGRCHGREQPN